MLTQIRLKEVLHYDPLIGVFTWKMKLGKRCIIGNEAGWIDRKNYRQIKIDSKSYLAHRLAFLYMLGKFPEEQVDHIDRNTLDNRWLKLRAVTNTQNSQNKKVRNDNTSGVMGVHWDKQRNKWRVVINVNGKRKHIGSFKTFQKAKAVRLATEVAFDYHPNHGK